MVYINGAYSQPMEIECGVLQGSCLGPLLFILVLNDLPTVSSAADTLYADDTTPFFAAESARFVSDDLQQDLLNVRLKKSSGS